MTNRNEEKRACTRKPDDFGYYDTDCTNVYEYGKNADDFKYCPFCGKEIQEQP
jgi:hypothetical protein